MSEVKCSVQNKIPAAGDLHFHPSDQKRFFHWQTQKEGRGQWHIYRSGDSCSSDNKQPVKFLIKRSLHPSQRLRKRSNISGGSQNISKSPRDGNKETTQEGNRGGSLLDRIRQVRGSSVFRRL